MLDIIFNNWKLKLLAFIIGVFIWFHAVTEKRIVYTMKIPVVVKDIPEGMVVDSISADSVKIRIEARRKDILLLNWFGKKEIFLEVGGIDKKVARMDIYATYVHLPIWINLKVRDDISPPYLKIYLSEKSEKELPVRSVVRGRPAEGYWKKTPYIINPPRVLVSGGKETVDRLTQVLTQPVDIDGAKDTVVAYVHVINPTHKRLRFSPDSVLVKVPIEKTVQKEIWVSSDFMLDYLKYKRIKVMEDSVRFVVAGPQSDMEKLMKEDILSYVELVREGDSLLIDAVFPNYMMLVKTEPKYLHIVK